VPLAGRVGSAPISFPPAHRATKERDAGMGTTRAIRIQKSQRKVRASAQNRFKTPCPFCGYHIPYGKLAECTKRPSECPLVSKPLKRKSPRKLVPGLNRANDATCAKPRKHPWWVGAQGSFHQIREDLRAANPKLKGNALSTLTNEIFHGQKDKRAVIISLHNERI
jgi:hypothetical protein